VVFYTGPQSADLRIIEEFKPHLGEYRRETEETLHEQAASSVIRQLKIKAEEELDDRVSEAIVAVPNEIHRASVFSRLLQIADLGADIVDETIAALCYVDFMKGGILTREQKRVMVIDYGGGTCNVTIASVSYGRIFASKRQLNPLASVSDWVGGRIVDQALLSWLKNRPGVAGSEQALLTYARQTKEEICSRYDQLDEDQPIPIIPERDETSLTRCVFENIVRNPVSKIKQPIGQAIDEAQEKTGESPLDLDAVFMVGGSSNIPIAEEVAREFLEGTLGGRVDVQAIRPSMPSSDLQYGENPWEVISDPRLAVSCGAALYKFYMKTQNRQYVVDQLPISVELKLPEEEEPISLLQKGVEIPPKKPFSRIVRAPTGTQVKIELWTRRDEDEPASLFDEHVFEFEDRSNLTNLLRIYADLDVCGRIHVWVRPVQGLFRGSPPERSVKRHVFPRYVHI
jgi:molecular chaperone DnaK (HSP70)